MVKRKKILVHICCAACASHVFKDLLSENFEIIAFFYNPQVHGKSEYDRRLADVSKLCADKNITLVEPKYESDDFFSMLEPYQNESSIKYITDKDRYRRKRCELCLDLLVEQTVLECRKNKIKVFTTTMLCSPYKDHNKIWDLGMQAAVENNLQFYYKDFRKGYWMGRNFARNHDMMIPAYCGCIDSLNEGRLE